MKGGWSEKLSGDVISEMALSLKIQWKLTRGSLNEPVDTKLFSLYMPYIGYVDFKDLRNEYCTSGRFTNVHKVDYLNKVVVVMVVEGSGQSSYPL